jgi:hypothetical protein
MTNVVSMRRYLRGVVKSLLREKLEDENTPWPKRPDTIFTQRLLLRRAGPVVMVQQYCFAHMDAPDMMLMNVLFGKRRNQLLQLRRFSP